MGKRTEGGERVRRGREEGGRERPEGYESVRRGII
jgi:hypothetical protein